MHTDRLGGHHYRSMLILVGVGLSSSEQVWIGVQWRHPDVTSRGNGWVSQVSCLKKEGVIYHVTYPMMRSEIQSIWGDFMRGEIQSIWGYMRWWATNVIIHSLIILVFWCSIRTRTSWILPPIYIVIRSCTKCQHYNFVYYGKTRVY